MRTCLDEITGAEMETANDLVVSHIDELRQSTPSGLGHSGKPCDVIALLSIGWHVQSGAACGQYLITFSAVKLQRRRLVSSGVPSADNMHA